MVQKGTYLIPVDRCGVWWVNTFHIYGGATHKIGKVGSFVKVSIRNTRPNNWIRKKSKLRGIILRTKAPIYKRDGSFIKFKTNGVVLLKKRLTPKGKELIGPAIFMLRRRRFINSFSGILL